MVEGLGMNYVRIPVDEVRPWSQLPPGAIAKYFELLNNPKNYPIFFHCRRGADRTGAFAALYRIALQHWDAKKAYSEARDIGLRWYYSGLKSQIYDFHPPAATRIAACTPNSGYSPQRQDTKRRKIESLSLCVFVSLWSATTSSRSSTRSSGTCSKPHSSP